MVADLRKKIIVFGTSGVGKTSTVLTSFFGYPFEAIEKIKPTKGISIDSVMFRGLVDISIWDCAGQDKYMSNHFSERGKMRIFSDVDIAIMLLDASRQETFNIKFINKFMSVVLEYNPNIKKVYIFINKIDIAPPNINDNVMKLTEKILDQWENGFVEIINCSVKMGTTRKQFIQLLDSTLTSDDLVAEKREFFSACLADFKDIVDGYISLFHTPSMLLTASTHEDGWLMHETLINKKVNLRSIFNSMEEDTIVECDGSVVILMKINDRSLLLLEIPRSRAGQSDEIIREIRDHQTFSDLRDIYP